MEIERLIEQLYKHHEDYGQGKAQSLFNLSCDCKQAADALEQLQAENDRLRKERDDAIRQLKFFAPCAGCKWYRGIKGCAHEIGCDTERDFYEFVAKEE